MASRLYTLVVFAVVLVTGCDGNIFHRSPDKAVARLKRAVQAHLPTQSKARKLQECARKQKNVCTAGSDGSIADWTVNMYDATTCDGTVDTSFSWPPSEWPDVACTIVPNEGQGDAFYSKMGCVDTVITITFYTTNDCSGLPVNTMPDDNCACGDEGPDDSDDSDDGPNCALACTIPPSSCDALATALDTGCLMNCTGLDLKSMETEEEVVELGLPSCPAWVAYTKGIAEVEKYCEQSDFTMEQCSTLGAGCCHWDEDDKECTAESDSIAACSGKEAGDIAATPPPAAVATPPSSSSTMLGRTGVVIVSFAFAVVQMVI